MEFVAIAIGSNLGDRELLIQTAIARLRQWISNLVAAKPIETEPAGVPPGQPRFLNTAVIGCWDGDARTLLNRLLDLERDLGRERPFRGAPRTIDLDLIICGDRIVDEAGLQVPHPRFRERDFVLRPLAQIAPDMIDPVTGRSIAELYRRWEEERPCASL